MNATATAHFSLSSSSFHQYLDRHRFPDEFVGFYLDGLLVLAIDETLKVYKHRCEMTDSKTDNVGPRVDV